MVSVCGTICLVVGHYASRCELPKRKASSEKRRLMAYSEVVKLWLKTVHSWGVKEGAPLHSFGKIRSTKRWAKLGMVAGGLRVQWEWEMTKARCEGVQGMIFERGRSALVSDARYSSFPFV
jgi:hypothetical protein